MMFKNDRVIEANVLLGNFFWNLRSIAYVNLQTPVPARSSQSPMNPLRELLNVANLDMDQEMVSINKFGLSDWRQIHTTLHPVQ